MPARPSRVEAATSAAPRQNGVLKRTIDTRQTTAMTASAAANGSTTRETTVAARASSGGQSFRTNKDIALGLACTVLRRKHQWGRPDRACPARSGRATIALGHEARAVPQIRRAVRRAGDRRAGDQRRARYVLRLPRQPTCLDRGPGRESQGRGGENRILRALDREPDRLGGA